MQVKKRWGQALVIPLLVILAGCSTSATDDEGSSEAAEAQTSEAVETSVDDAELTTEASTEDSPAAASDLPVSGDCEAIAASFRDVTSANEDLPDPELTATCNSDSVTVEANGIPDYPYVETSPGSPTGTDATFVIPVEPVEASATTEVAALGSIAVAVNGVPIYGATEGTGGDVLSLVGALSECGSHNGPADFHMHLLGYAEGVDCLFTADEIASGSQLVGWSTDGYPIMSGTVCTDETCETTEQLGAHRRGALLH